MRNDPFSAHVGLFVIVRFSTALAFAVVLAFAFALVALPIFLCSCPFRCCRFCLCSCPCSCFCFCLCLCFCSFLYHPRPLDVSLSEVIQDQRLVRVQVVVDDRSQLVLLTLKLLGVHKQMISQFPCAFPQHHADLHVSVLLC